MSHLKNILILFSEGTSSYEDNITLAQDDIRGRNHPFISEIDLVQLRDNLKEEMEKNMENPNEFVEMMSRSKSYATLPVSWPYSNTNKDKQVFLEKLYFDLFSSEEDFNPELLRFIDPETGELAS